MEKKELSITKGLRFVIGIKDPIHGIILLTRNEYDVTISPFFDRLRYIKKSGLANLVYPSHNSTRYEHSLGTMQIAYSITKNAMEIYLRRYRKRWRDEWSDEYELAEILQLVRFAALLHDVGHGPFSHTSETILRQILERHYPSDFKELSNLGFNNVHEYYSYKLIIGETTIREAIIDAGINPYDVASLLSKNYPNIKELLLKPPAWSILRDIIDSQVDADRLDNLLRDSYGMGVPYGLVDTDNLIKNIHIVELERDKLMLVTHIRSLGSVEDMLDARYKMYRWLYYHQKVNLLDTIIRILIQNLIEDNYVKPDFFHYTRYVIDEINYIDDNYIVNMLRQAYKESSERYYLFKGLFNQEYLPLPIWSTFEEYVAKIRSIGNNDDPYTTAKKVSSLFNNDEIIDSFTENLKDSIDRDIEVIAVTREPTTPYDWRGEEEIFFYVPLNKIVKMSEISLYIQKLVEMSKKYTHFYLYFYIPRVKRRNLIKLKNKVEETFLNYIKENKNNDQ